MGYFGRGEGKEKRKGDRERGMLVVEGRTRKGKGNEGREKGVS